MTDEEKKILSRIIRTGLLRITRAKSQGVSPMMEEVNKLESELREIGL